MAYLEQGFHNNFKGMTPFSCSLSPTTSYSSQEIVALFKKVVLQFEQMEKSFSGIGTTASTRFVKKLFSLIDHYNLGGKGRLLGVSVLGALLVRYIFFKDKHYAATPLFPNDTRFPWLNRATATAEPYARWVDENIVGTKPNKTSYFEGSKLFTEEEGGTGFFGKIHRHHKDILTWAYLPVSFSKQIENFVSGVNNWKTLKNNPKSFFRFDELFKNKQQKISAIDEFFLSNAIEHSTPRLTFDDIAGLQDQKRQLQPVINYLLNPELFEKTGTAIEKGYLLYGPTRTGKTYLAEALAGELVLKHKKKLSFIKLRGSELRMTGIKKILDMVEKYAPCIVFIDELDLLNLQRDHNAMLLDEFLTSMKHDTTNHQVIFLAATNRIDHIDHALLQPGRFGKIIPFENPPLHDRAAFFQKHLSRKNLYDPELLDMKRLVQETEGCSFGELASITNNALTLATQKKEMLSYRHFDRSIDTFKNKIADSEINLPAEERRVVAVHLAGHALAYTLLATGEQFHKVTMLPIQKKVTENNIWLNDLSYLNSITSYGEVFTLHKINTAGFDTAEQKTNRIKALLAGYAAEKLLIGSCGYGYHNDDYEQARQIAESLVFQGIKKEHFSREAADKKLNEIMDLLEHCENEVSELLRKNKDKLERITQLLNEHITLTADDIATMTA
jgi:cell division protease FtsH